MTLEEVLQSGNYYLVDVREAMELEMDGMIEGAKNIPLGEIDDRKNEVLTLDKPIVFFCRSGNRSAKAIEILQSSGLEHGINGGGYEELSSKIN